MFNKISLSSKELHKVWYKNIKNILDFFKSNNEIYTPEIVLELDKISESISLILSNSKNVNKPDFLKINKKLKDSKFKTEITCDFVSEIEKTLKEKLASFKQEDIDKLDKEIQYYTELLEWVSVKEKAENIESFRELKQLEIKKKKISQLQEQIANIELVRKTYLEELEKSKNKEDQNTSKQEPVGDVISVEEENRTEVIFEEIKEEKLENETVLEWEDRIDEDVEEFNEETRGNNKKEAEELINTKKDWKFRCKDAEMKLILEFVNAEELKEFYLKDRKNFWTWNKHYNYYLYYCEAFERLESDLDPIFWETAINNLGAHVDRVYQASWDFNPELRKIANRLREEIRLREENKLADDINSWDNIIKQVSSAVVYILPKSSIQQSTTNLDVKIFKWTRKKNSGDVIIFDRKNNSKWIILKWEDKKHLEYKMMLDNYFLNFPRDRSFSQNSEKYIKQNENEDIFIYELIIMLSKYDIDIMTDFIRELYQLNLEDIFYATLYENIINNNAFENEDIDVIEWFKKIAEEEELEEEEVKLALPIEELLEEKKDEYLEENKDWKSKLRGLLEDLKNEDPQTMDLLHNISKEVNERELLLEEEYFNRWLDRQFNNILEEKNIEKLYAFVVLYTSENILISRKINELLLFGLTKEEKKSNSKVIKKILTILNK